MTRKEAIDLIYRRSQHCKETAEAFEVLKEEPCEDAISLTKEAYSDLCLKASKADDLQRALDMEKGAYNALVKNIQCEDAISRQSVLDAIDAAAWAFCDYLIRNGRNDEQKPVSLFVDKLREYVREELPPVNPQRTGHWIPVEEKTPEKAGEYFISWHGKLGRKYYGEYIEFGEFDPHDGWNCPGAEERGYTDITVTAWMPLPEPYREEEIE